MKDGLVEELIAHYDFYKGTAFCRIQELALVLGVKRPTVYNWLKRRTRPKEGQLEMINKWLQEKQAELKVRE